MNTLVLYYSYGGSTKAIAEALATEKVADIAEIKDLKRPGKLKAYTAGCFAALRGRAWPIRPLDADLAKYDNLVLLAPVWANNPAPAFNAIFDKLPAGKDISLKMVSMSGKSNCRARLEATIENKGCALESFEDIKA